MYAFNEDQKVFDMESPKSPARRRLLVAALVVIPTFLLVLGWYWSRTPALFDVKKTEPVATGITTTSTLINVVNTLLQKPGGYITNDLTPPGILLDNMPNWEYGVLIQSRDMSKAMREAFSRSLSQSTEDSDLAEAESRLNFDNKSWAIPATESEYKQSVEFLQSFLTRLSDDDPYNAQFYARADNLRYWLSTVETRLGSLSQRLSASVGQKRLNIDSPQGNTKQQATSAPKEIHVKTPWREIDDVFYEARGSSWALIHFLKAVEVDFAPTLQKKNAQISLQQIIRELEATQSPISSPVILNGGGFGLWANHSLVMASYISRANASIIDLRELLSQG